MMALIPRPFLVLICCLVAIATAASDDSVDHGVALVEWVRSKPGGFVSDKVEIRHMDLTDTTSPYGVFVNEDVAIDERLLAVPTELYIALSAGEIEPSSDEHEDEVANINAYFRNTCRLAGKLKAEWEKGEEKSAFGPYINYLKTQRKGQIPATWSTPGKALLRQVLETSELYRLEMNALDWIDTNFKKNKDSCLDMMAGDDAAAFNEHIVALTIQRGYDTQLIPIWDMVNHDNGVQNNLRTNSWHDGIQIWASKSIQKGGELFASYNFCLDCKDIGREWGTPGILRDFGFCEGYPHVWFFEERDLWFQVDEQDGALVPGFWLEEGDVEEEVLESAEVGFLEVQQARVEALLPALNDRKRHADVPEHEWQTTVKFASAFVADLAVAIATTKKRVASRDEL